jgi:hypothetical protein
MVVEVKAIHDGPPTCKQEQVSLADAQSFSHRRGWDFNSVLDSGRILLCVAACCRHLFLAAKIGSVRAFTDTIAIIAPQSRSRAFVKHGSTKNLHPPDSRSANAGCSLAEPPISWFVVHDRLYYSASAGPNKLAAMVVAAYCRSSCHVSWTYESYDRETDEAKPFSFGVCLGHRTVPGNRNFIRC